MTLEETMLMEDGWRLAEKEMPPERKPFTAVLHTGTRGALYRIGQYVNYVGSPWQVFPYSYVKWWNDL